MYEMRNKEEESWFIIHNIIYINILYKRCNGRYHTCATLPIRGTRKVNHNHFDKPPAPHGLCMVVLKLCARFAIFVIASLHSLALLAASLDTPMALVPPPCLQISMTSFKGPVSLYINVTKDVEGSVPLAPNFEGRPRPKCSKNLGTVSYPKISRYLRIS